MNKEVYNLMVYYFILQQKFRSERMVKMINFLRSTYYGETRRGIDYYEIEPISICKAERLRALDVTDHLFPLSHLVKRTLKKLAQPLEEDE